MVNNKYLNSYKKKVVEMIKTNNLSTKVTAQQLNIPLKTLEKWITAYNKNPKVFNKVDKIDSTNYYNIY